METFGGGIWWREIVEALVEALVEGYGGGIKYVEVIGGGKWWMEALVEGYGGLIRWSDLVEKFGGGKGWRRWWRDMQRREFHFGSKIWWRELVEGFG